MSEYVDEKGPREPKVFDLPEPEIRAHEVGSDELPRSPKALAKLAVANGWNVVRVTHARGPYINADGSLNRIVDSLLFVASKTDVEPVAIAVSWITDADGAYKRHSGYISTLTNGCRYADDRAIKAVLKGETA